MAKRYTIELSIHEVDEDGDTLPQEVEGVTLDYATSFLMTASALMDYLYELGNDSLGGHSAPQPPGTTVRRLEVPHG